MTVSEEFAQLIDDLGLGDYQESGGTIFLFAMPPSPDRAKAIAPYGGSGEADSRLPYDEPKIQIRCRSTNPAEAEADAQAVYDALTGLGMRLLPGGTWLQLVVCLQHGPVYIGLDSNRRHEFVINLRAEISRPTQHRV